MDVIDFHRNLRGGKYTYYITDEFHLNSFVYHIIACILSMIDYFKTIKFSMSRMNVLTVKTNWWHFIAS